MNQETLTFGTFGARLIELVVKGGCTTQGKAKLRPPMHRLRHEGARATGSSTRTTWRLLLLRSKNSQGKKGPNPPLLRTLRVPIRVSIRVLHTGLAEGTNSARRHPSTEHGKPDYAEGVKAAKQGNLRQKRESHVLDLNRSAQEY